MGGESCTVGDLVTPTSPAFIMIGASPTLVERPSTPRDVALTVYDSVEGGLPDDLALEVAPYWLFQHPELTYAQYVHAGAGRQLAQNFTISFATVDANDTADGPGFTELAVGFRSHIFATLTSGVDEGLQMARKARTRVEQTELTLGDLQKRRLLERGLEREDCLDHPDAEPCRTLLAEKKSTMTPKPR